MMDRSKLFLLAPGFWIVPEDIILLWEGSVHPTTGQRTFWKLGLRGKPDVFYMEPALGDTLNDFLVQWAEEFKE